VRSPRLTVAAGAALVAAIALALLGWQARPLDAATHSRVVTDLAKLQELDADIDETVLKLRDALLNTYDPLVVTLALVNAHERDLEFARDAVARVGGPELLSAMIALRGKVAEKQALLERFKSDNALLRNSFHYFPLSVDKLLRDPQVPDALRGRVQRLQRDVLLLRVGATYADYELTALQVRQLEQEEVGSSLRERTRLVALHANNVLTHQATVDRLVRDITEAGLKPASHALAEAYNRAFERKLREANAYRFILLLASAALLSYAAFAFFRLRQGAAAMRESEERYRKLFDLSPDALLIHTDGRIMFVNGMCARLFGAASPADMVGKPVLELFHPESHERVRQRIRQTMQEQRIGAPEERRILRLDGSAGEVEVAASAFTHQGKPSVQVVLRDITERNKARERLNYLAQYDSLTGLPNRTLFRDRLEQGLSHAQRSPRPAALLFIDVDRFKEVNDTLGHAIGDKLLQQVAERLKACVRSGDTVGRFGGDEFGVILMDLAKPGDAGLVAQKINDSLAQPFDIDGHQIFVSASIGITLYPADAADAGTLSMNADAAMYRAKEKGRNNHQFFTPEMNERAMQRMEMEASMRRALQQSEFALHYQPKVDLASGEICGIEALLRWSHPQKGPVSPAEFVPILEDTGLIIPVGEWVMREACRQIGAWQKAGLMAPPVAVNLSARQFQDKGLEDKIRAIIAESGIDPTLLQLEITESLLMNDPKAAERILLALKDAGVKLSIDDFGTGYSSLAYLRRFPLDVLKIDRAFIKDIVGNPDDAAITLAVISLAHSLMLKVVAEGVETEAQVNLLTQHGCDEFQGYFFSKAVPASELEALIRQGRRLQRSKDWDTSNPAVLLVDDNEEDLRLLERALRSERFVTLTAKSAAEAFALLASHPVGVVISDQRMPGMDGTEFLMKLGRLYPNALRVAISGAYDPHLIADAVNRGRIHKFLSKSWTRERLKSEVLGIYQTAIQSTLLT
jgi:diguanylate cyclase (GGDEF)-like protein/PAS domain S-box-containing protein